MWIEQTRDDETREDYVISFRRGEGVTRDAEGATYELRGAVVTLEPDAATGVWEATVIELWGVAPGGGIVTERIDNWLTLPHLVRVWLPLRLADTNDNR